MRAVFVCGDAGGEAIVGRINGAMRLRLAVVALCAGLGLAACGSSSSNATTWHSLRSVRVTVARPGLPPPYGAPKTTSYTTPAQLAKVTSALNQFHIAQRSAASSSQGCGGGSQILITIVPQQGRTVSLTGYLCANRTTGNIGGDLPGVLSAMKRGG